MKFLRGQESFERAVDDVLRASHDARN